MMYKVGHLSFSSASIRILLWLEHAAVTAAALVSVPSLWRIDSSQRLDSWPDSDILMSRSPRDSITFLAPTPRVFFCLLHCFGPSVCWLQLTEELISCFAGPVTSVRALHRSTRANFNPFWLNVYRPFNYCTHLPVVVVVVALFIFAPFCMLLCDKTCPLLLLLFYYYLPHSSGGFLSEWSAPGTEVLWVC